MEAPKYPGLSIIRVFLSIKSLETLSLCDLRLIFSSNLGPEIPGVESLSPSSSEIIKTLGTGGLTLE